VSRRAHAVALVLLGLVAFGAAVATNRWLFPLYSLNRDDSVYVAMARLIEHGHVTLPAAGHEAFRPWASAIVGDRIVLKYTPPWPAVLAAAELLTGSVRVGLGVAAAAAAVLTALVAGEVLRDRTAGVVAGVLLVLSPVFLVQSGTYLPYVPQLAMELGAAFLLLSGVRRRSTGRVVAAGALLAVAGWARPFDALLFGLPFLVLVLLDARSARRGGTGGWTEVGTLLRLAAGAAPVVVLVLVYDALVVGSPLRLPYTVTGPQDGFGFGRRGVFPQSTISFNPVNGVDGLLANLRWLPSWTAGGIVLVALAVVGLFRTSGRARWAVAALAVVVPLGYLPFWGPYAMGRLWPGVRLFGFFYHLPVLVPLVTFGAAGLLALARATRSGRPPWLRPVTAAVVAAMVVLTALALPDKVAANLAVRDDYRALQRFVDDQHLGTAVLLLPYRGDLGFESTSPFLENDASLDQPVLYAEQRGARDLELVDGHPDRALYRLTQQLAPGRTTGGRLAIDRLRVTSGPTVTVHLRLTNPTDRPVAVTYADVAGGAISRVLDRSSAPGRSYDVSWTVAVPGADTPPPGDGVRLPAGSTSGVLSLGLRVEQAGAGAADLGRRWEQRIAYRLVDGGTRVELLLPGERWFREDGPGAPWVPDASAHAVTDIG